MSFLLWCLIGILPSLYLFWLIICRDVFEECRDARKPGFPEQVNLSEAMVTVGCFAAAIIMWPLIVMFAVGFTWHEWRFGDIVLWRKKEIPKKEKIAELEKKAKKLGLILKEPAPINLK